MQPPPQSDPRTVTIIGCGVAGMTAASALAEAGYRVQLVERRGYLGGRASSYLHPGVNEVIDNCQHALIGAYTNLIAFYRRIGVADKIHWTTNYTMIEPGGRRSALGASPLPAPLHGLPKLLTCGAFSTADKLSLVRAFTADLARQWPRSKRVAGRMAATATAIEGRSRALLAPGHRQRPQLRHRPDRRQLRHHGHPRPLYGFAPGRRHGHEHPAPQRTLCARARIPRRSWRRRAAQRKLLKR